MKSYLLKGFQAPKIADHLESRISILINNDLNILLSAPKNLQEDYFYKNTDGDEVIFVHKGTGTLRTFVGNLKFKEGDYLVIPRGMIYTMKFNNSDNRLFIVESYTPVYTPKRYRNWFGQLLEHSPFCERDFRAPSELETHHEKGDFIVNVCLMDREFESVQKHLPLVEINTIAAREHVPEIKSGIIKKKN